MKEEIKEILEKLKENISIVSVEEEHLLLDYITNLQEENEELNNIINEIEKEIETFDKSDFNTNNIIIFANNIINIMKEGDKDE